MKIQSYAIVPMLMCLLTAASTYSQSFGVRGGLNLSSQRLEIRQSVQDEFMGINPGFHLGPTAEFALGRSLSIETAVLFTTKGNKYTYNESGIGGEIEEKQTINLSYIDVPVAVKKNFNVGNIDIFGALGPYLGIGLSGTEKYSYREGDEEANEEEFDIMFGPKDDAEARYNRFEFGLVARAGVEINNLQVGLSYVYGISDLSHVGNGLNRTNRVLQLSLGYQFAGSN